MTHTTTTTTTPHTPTPQSSSAPRKDRRRRRKLGQMPRPVLPMRALWESASGEQQAQAHDRAVWMLEYWLGRMSKREAAAAMSVTPLRVWQLSQMAVAGMVCGLLPQPRYRKGIAVSASSPGEDPKALRKRIAKLEEELATAQRLIDILKHLPGQEVSADSTSSKAPAASTSKPKKEKPTSRRGGSSGRRGRGQGS